MSLIGGALFLMALMTLTALALRSVALGGSQAPSKACCWTVASRLKFCKGNCDTVHLRAARTWLFSIWADLRRPPLCRKGCRTELDVGASLEGGGRRSGIAVQFPMRKPPKS